MTEKCYSAPGTSLGQRICSGLRISTATKVFTGRAEQAGKLRPSQWNHFVLSGGGGGGGDASSGTLSLQLETPCFDGCDNFAPLGPDLQCIFDTPMRRDFHQGTGIAEYNGTINATSMPATYLSPQRILCEAPPYQRVGPTTLYVNSSYNTSLFERPEWGVVAQVQPRRRASQPCGPCARA